MSNNPRSMFSHCNLPSVAASFALCLASLSLSVSNHDANSPSTEALASETTEDWPTFLGPTGDGKSAESGIKTDWTDGKLPVLWRHDVGEGYGIGSVANGKYFHFDKKGGNARLRCFQADTGESVWEFSYPSNYEDLYGYDSGPRASPVIDGNRLYLFGVEGMLHCLDVDVRKVVWKIDTNKQFGVVQNFFGVASTPVIHDDLLITMIGGSPPEAQKIPPGQLDRVTSNGSAIVAFQKATGEVRYQIGEDLASYTSIKIEKFGDRMVGLAWLRDSLIGFDPTEGTILFDFPFRSRKLESVNASTPVVKPPFIFLSECYGLGSVLLELNGTKPKVIWNDQGRRDKSLEAHWNTPILVDGFLYGCSGRHPSNSEIRCVELATGVVKWSKPGFTRSSITYVDGHLIVLDEMGRLILLRVNSERFDLVTEYDGTKDKVKFRSPCWAAPIISNGLMFVRGKKEVVCFDLKAN